MSDIIKKEILMKTRKSEVFIFIYLHFNFQVGEAVSFSGDPEQNWLISISFLFKFKYNFINFFSKNQPRAVNASTQLISWFKSATEIFTSVGSVSQREVEILMACEFTFKVIQSPVKFTTLPFCCVYFFVQVFCSSGG